MKKSLWERLEARLAEFKAEITGNRPDAKAENDKVIADFKAEIEAAKEESEEAISAKDGEITKLNAKITELGGQITAKDGEIKTLTDEAKSAQDRAVEMVSAMGIDPAQIPAAPAEKKTGTQAKSLKEQYRILQQTDPAKAGEFYLANRDKPEFYK